MNAITHHTPDALLAAYAAGSLPQPFALVVATQVSLCLDSRAALEAHQHVGGVVMESCEAQGVSAGLKSSVLDRLDDAYTPEPVYQQSGSFPAPLMQALGGKPPKWKALGTGVRQSIIEAGPEGSARLLYIPPGEAVPDHGHNGMELTLVLEGSFSDHTGRYGVGDLEVADQSLDHTPIAGEGTPCICLAATDAPLKFNRLIPKLLQPFFGI